MNNNEKVLKILTEIKNLTISETKELLDMYCKEFSLTLKDLISIGESSNSSSDNNTEEDKKNDENKIVSVELQSFDLKKKISIIRLIKEKSKEPVTIVAASLKIAKLPSVIFSGTANESKVVLEELIKIDSTAKAVIKK